VDSKGGSQDRGGEGITTTRKSSGDWEAMTQDTFQIKYVTGTKVYLDDSGESPSPRIDP
jgi:hypothetical protein